MGMLVTDADRRATNTMALETPQKTLRVAIADPNQKYTHSEAKGDDRSVMAQLSLDTFLRRLSFQNVPVRGSSPVSTFTARASVLSASFKRA
ncbi:hypothetical protein MPLA_290042 [Mesorhizobium sp. ORS 3359]|nr:hypothetical protein MPLA_290042 [Mesorhizobium sp. ORS 3359]